MRAAILTIGNEIVSGDVPNSNASWIAKQLEPLGVKVVVMGSVPDVAEQIVEWVRRERQRVDHLFVTGGLGGTPDDITREAIAAAFEVEQELLPELAADLRSRFTGNPDYVTPWAALPKGARPLENPLGGAPGFQLQNVWVFPGLPREMEAMFLRYAEEFRTAAPIAVWRRRERTRESLLADALVHATDTWPAVSVGSYPYFTDDGPEVEIVLKSSDPAQFQAAVAYMDSEIERSLG